MANLNEWLQEQNPNKHATETARREAPLRLFGSRKPRVSVHNNCLAFTKDGQEPPHLRSGVNHDKTGIQGQLGRSER